MQASARQSYGRYKPIIRHDSGRTEVLGKRTKSSYLAIVNGHERYCRGLTFATRDQAIAYAQDHINRLQKRIDDRRQAYAARHTG
jgi:hypothetical protein